MSYVVPFNYCPVSTTVKTSSYTVPTGQYARVIANLEGSASLTIDGVTAIRGTQHTALSSSNMSVQSQDAVGGAGGISTTYRTNVTLTGAGAAQGFTNIPTNAFNTTTDQKTVIADFWVPAGTVISGTGTWRAVVSIYNQIN
jgi:hypothetical protein